MNILLRNPRGVAASLGGVVLAASGASAALPNDTIKIYWLNATGRSISLASFVCNPSGTCTFPFGGIDSGTTGTLSQTVPSGAAMRSITARYNYWDGVAKSCQVYVSVYKYMSGNVSSPPDSSFLKTDGNSSSPKCTPLYSTWNQATCDFTYTVKIEN